TAAIAAVAQLADTDPAPLALVTRLRAVDQRIACRMVVALKRELTDPAVYDADLAAIGRVDRDELACGVRQHGKRTAAFDVVDIDGISIGAESGLERSLGIAMPRRWSERDCGHRWTFILVVGGGSRGGYVVRATARARGEADCAALRASHGCLALLH